MTEYRSLDELMAGKAPGSLVVKSSDGVVFRPYFRTVSERWHGERNGEEDSFYACDPEWKPYVPAPPKVKRYLWGNPNTGGVLWLTEKQAGSHRDLIKLSDTPYECDQ